MRSLAANRRVLVNSLHHLPPNSVAVRRTNPNKWIELTVGVRRLKQLDGSKNRWRLGTNRCPRFVGDEGMAMAGQPGFFDLDERLRELSAKSEELERLNAVVDFELFR